MIKRMTVLFFVFLALIPMALEARDPKWRVNGAIGYDKGNFGTEDTTETWYFPFTLERLFKKGGVGLTLPLLLFRTTGQTTLVNGSPQRIRQARKTQTMTQGGLGDLLLKGRYSLFKNFALMGKVKFPTADENDGLGTGEFDFGGGGEFSFLFLERWIGYFDVSYTYIGGADLQNQWLFSPGVGYQWTPKISSSIFYEERTAVLSGQPNSRSILLNGLFQISKRVHLTTLLEFGLSNGSPDYGLTMGGGYLF